MKQTPKKFKIHPRRAGKTSDPEFESQVEEVRKAFGMKLRERWEQQIWSAPLPENPNAPLDDAIRDAIADAFALPDPLELKGIGKDWIYVIHPIMERELKEHAQREGLDLFNMTIYGRPIFVNSRVPQDIWRALSPQKARELFADDPDIQRYLDGQR